MQPNQEQKPSLSVVQKIELPELILVCTHCGGDRYIKRRKDQKGDQVYLCKLCGKTFVNNSSKFVVNQNIQAEYLKDVWDVRSLGIEHSKSKSQYKINFTFITQEWLREVAKSFVRYSLATIVHTSVVSRLLAVTRFSKFLLEYYPNIALAEVNRSVVIDFLGYLASGARSVGEGELSAATRSRNVSALRIFFEFCNRADLLPTPARRLIYDDDFPKRPKVLPRFIPEEVIEQLLQNLDSLSVPVGRMTQMLLECGMRISELCLLQFNCLTQDASGDWFLRYYQMKMKKEITIPISRETVAVVQAQQRYIRQELKEDYNYLFSAFDCGSKNIPRPKPSPMRAASYPTYLNKLAKNKSIKDASGELWHFQSHQFRHTVGTRMINNGVPQHIIQRFLGHENPDMTSTYAHIHDKTLKKEIEKFHGKIVNIAGQLIEIKDSTINSLDLEWFKRNIQAQSLPNGSCALPSISQGCPHANACLTCSHFRTTAEYLTEHKKQLEQTLDLINKAKANGWQRQIEMNERVAENLEKIIGGLEND